MIVFILYPFSIILLITTFCPRTGHIHCLQINAAIIGTEYWVRSEVGR